MEIVQEDSHFQATALDTGGFGCKPDKASITGYIDGNEISFVKQYHSTISFDQNYQSTVEEGKLSHEVEYWGTFDPSSDTFSGHWEIHVLIHQIGDQWIDETSTGTWMMKKIYSKF